MAKKIKESKEEEMKMKKEADEAKEKKEACGKEAAGEEEVVGDPAHKDEDQDIALIKKIIAEYLGKEGEMDESTMETMESLAKEAYEAYKEMGYSEDEAKVHAGHALKLAKHMASKSEADESDKGEEKPEASKKDAKPEGEEKSADEEGEPVEADVVAEAEEVEEAEEKKESAKKIKALENKLIETQGQLAAMKIRFSKDDVEKYVETKLAESKRPRAVTSAFKAAAGVFKSKEDFTSKWTLFCEGLKNSRVAVDYGAMFTEKGPATETGTTSKGLNFSDCAE